MESSCIYCGCGCRLNYEVKDNKIVRVSGVLSDDVSEGKPCIKGLMINEVFDQNRISSPLINGKPVTLKQALDYVYNNTKNLAPNEVFFNTSGKITNEDNYVIQKFARTCYQTPNIDSCCGRLCHNATVMGMKNVFGAPNLTVMNESKKIDFILIIGSEPEKDYPVFYNKLANNKKLKITRVHSFLKGCSEKECIVTIRPGSETCLLNGLINELIKKGLKSDVDGFEIMKEVALTYDADYVCNTCQISERTYKKLINDVYNSKRFGVFHGMGLTQHLNSLENIHSLLNLLLLKNGIILSLRGEVNVQGAGDLGGMPGLLPSGPLSNKTIIEKEWGLISESKGLNIIEALMLSPVRAVFLIEFNPYKSMPDTEQLNNKLRKTFKVYFGAYNNEASKKADVVIPIASLLGSEGTITNGERRLRKVNKVINNQPQLWQVLGELSKKFGKKKYFDYTNSREVFNELKRLVPDYNKINTNDLWRGRDDWAEKSIKYERFMPEHFDGLDDVTSDKYPYILTTYRSSYAFLGNEVTKNSKTLSDLQEPVGFYFNPVDMKQLSLAEGERLTIESQTNSLTGNAYKSDRLPRGIIGAYMHYSKLMINKLFPLKFDEESFTPNYKAVAVRVKKD
ncbi:MAG: molybdopterin-dependent oxidoreductase [Candidatus Nanoarchaeia archaeon]|jgi:predicted molibdopterin-dependent oxidoreductase YjgC